MVERHAGADGGQEPGSQAQLLEQVARAGSAEARLGLQLLPPNAPAPGGNGLLGPEFAILDTATATARANFVHDLLFSSTAATNGILLDYSALPADPSDLVYWLGRYWLHDAMSSNLQLAVYNAIVDPRAGSTRRQKLAIYLTSLSPEFQIQR
ncbi:hypothetical protein ACN28S_42745 [Cystobacter fuscus]